MNVQKMIDSIEKSLTGVSVAIAQVTSALRAASTLADVKKLNSQLASLQATEFNLRMRLANLRAAGATVPSLTPQEVSSLKAATAALDSAIVDRTVVAATIAFASTVLSSAKEIEGLLA